MGRSRRSRQRRLKVKHARSAGLGMDGVMRIDWLNVTFAGVRVAAYLKQNKRDGAWIMLSSGSPAPYMGNSEFGDTIMSITRHELPHLFITNKIIPAAQTKGTNTSGTK